MKLILKTFAGLSLTIISLVFITIILFVNTVFKLDLPKTYELQSICLKIPKDNESMIIDDKLQIKQILKMLKKSTSKTTERGSHIDYLYPDKQRAAVIIEFILKNNKKDIPPILLYIPRYPANFFEINQGGTGGKHRPYFDDAIELFDFTYNLFGKDIPDWYNILSDE